MTELPSRSLQGRVAVVTGASRGIGKQIALDLGRRGCRVVLTARTAEHQEGVIGSLEATRRQIENAGGTASAVPADLSLDADMRRLRDAALAAFGKVDILINNAAAMLYYVPFFEASLDRLDEEYRVNVRAPFFLTQLFARGMADRGGGVIVNLSSRIATLPPPPDALKPYSPGWASLTYAPTKAALNRLSVALAHELFQANVYVVTLYPGFTLTDRMEADPPPGLDLAQAESAEGLLAALVRVCENPMDFTGRVLGWRDVLEQPGR